MDPPCQFFNYEASGRELESYQEILSFTFEILHQDMQTQYCLCKAGLSTHIYCPAPQQQPNITLWRWPYSDECLKTRCSLAETVKYKRWKRACYITLNLHPVSSHLREWWHEMKVEVIVRASFFPWRSKLKKRKEKEKKSLQKNEKNYTRHTKPNIISG